MSAISSKDELMIPKEEGKFFFNLKKFVYNFGQLFVYIFSDAPEVEILNTSDDPILIFCEKGLKQLQRRTEELKTERAMQKNKFK